MIREVRSITNKATCYRCQIKSVFPLSSISHLQCRLHLRFSWAKVSGNGRNVKWFVKSQYLCLCTIFRFYVWPALPVLLPTLFLKWPQKEPILIKIIIICWTALRRGPAFYNSNFIYLDTEHRQLSLI